MKKQIIVIHGGTTFPTHEAYIEHLTTLDIDIARLRYKVDWKGSMAKDLGEAFDVITPKMPNSTNAQYYEWEIWLSNILTKIHGDVILIGHSLGGAFLLKYLSENTIKNKINALFLIAAPIESEHNEYLGEFTKPNDTSNILRQTNKIYIMHSEDDKVVPYVQSQKLHKSIPSSKLITLQGYGHFNKEHFPELINKLKSSQ